MEMRHPVIIGVTGGSGSGKTTVSREIFDHLKGESVVMIQQDSYYKAQDNISVAQRRQKNYDHPDAFDMALLANDLRKLVQREAIEEPIYDYKVSTRAKETRHVEPADVIIVEGVLLFVDQEVRDLLDIKVYVDTDDDLRFIRRLQRDMSERARTSESVITQYLETVKPMHHQFVEPTKRYADVILPEGGENKIGINMLEARIREILADAQH
ncbi:uridine kinase [Weissella soli]|uniref:Uridine kinase n=1 Tax=Weissella soli TaxID=155866 RepID=A0A288Q8U8_9LACO|nr:uridine kinase [Weissella soli]AOT56250.1 Uridine kinase [Weissella soli]NKY82709.1 uridine kinase [Weissella soli]RDL11824.1 uridine kinase [Weissella soli]GEN92948.1 uridine kinase [Weissella soli]